MYKVADWLHIFYLAAPIPILLKFGCLPYIYGCQRFRIFCRHMSGKRDERTILNALTKVGVWNDNVFNLAAPIPILPKFCCLPYIRVSTILLFLYAHERKKRRPNYP